MAGDDRRRGLPDAGLHDGRPTRSLSGTTCTACSPRPASTGATNSPTSPGFANYIMWNCLPGMLEYGYGDTPHVDNKLGRWWMYTHLSETMHWYGASRPQEAALAAYLRQRFPASFNTSIWCLYPYLLTDLEQAPPPLDPGKLPAARFFPEHGPGLHAFGRRPRRYLLPPLGRGYHRAAPSLRRRSLHDLQAGLPRPRNTGTRQGQTPTTCRTTTPRPSPDNTLLVKIPGEKPSPYWNGTVYGQAGGQDKQVGSKVVAFETGPDYSYVALDLAPVYNAEKCSQVVRQFLHVLPDHFVVFEPRSSGEGRLREDPGCCTSRASR